MTPTTLLNYFSECFYISIQDLSTPTKKESIVNIRQLYFYLGYNKYNLTQRAMQLELHYSANGCHAITAVQKRLDANHTNTINQLHNIKRYIAMCEKIKQLENDPRRTIKRI